MSVAVVSLASPAWAEGGVDAPGASDGISTTAPIEPQPEPRAHTQPAPIGDPVPTASEPLPDWTLSLDVAQAVALEPFLRGGDRGIGAGVGFRVGRTTVLTDGGIGDEGGGPSAAFPDEGTRRQRAHSYAQGDAEFDHYDLSLSWPVVTRGAATFSLVGGLRAITAQAGSRSLAPGNGAGPIWNTDNEHAMVAVPVIGTGVRLELGRGIHFTGEAATHTVDDGATLLDLIAQTGIQLDPNVGIFAGYQVIRSGMDVGSAEAELDQEGLFARLQIRF